MKTTGKFDKDFGLPIFECENCGEKGGLNEL